MRCTRVVIVPLLDTSPKFVANAGVSVYLNASKADSFHNANCEKQNYEAKQYRARGSRRPLEFGRCQRRARRGCEKRSETCCGEEGGETVQKRRCRRVRETPRGQEERGAGRAHSDRVCSGPHAWRNQHRR